MKKILIIVLLFTLFQRASNATAHDHLTPTEVAKLKLAIEDEIYDYGYYNEFYNIGENIGTSQHWVARARLYINPAYNSVDKHGEVIYKLMPYGQVYRLFYIDENGNVKLDGSPQSHFPITQPSHQTVFMDEEDVRRYEQAWMKTSFVVDTNPTTEMIRSAVQRQKIRTGFSDWEYHHPTQNGSKN